MNYTEKGSNLHAAIGAAGHWIKEVNGEWVCSDEVAVQALIDAYPLTSTQAEVIALIDLHAKNLRDSVVTSMRSAEKDSWAIMQKVTSA